MSDGGSQQPRLSAGVVIVHDDGDTYRYLVLRAYRYWDFPKGLVEPGETPLAAAQREAREETGLSDLQFRWGERHVETAPYDGGKIARYYLAASPTTAVTLGRESPLGRPEHHEYRWCDYPSARQLLVPRVLAVIEWAQRQLNERG